MAELTEKTREKRKRGGQPKPPGERRDHKLMLYLRRDEYDYIRESAEKQEVTLSEFVRKRVTHGRIGEAIERRRREQRT